MGYRTYSQIVNELSPNKWPFEGLKSYVITHRDIDDQSQIVLHGQGIKHLIDTYFITSISTFIGQGVRLFQLEDVQKRLKLESTTSYNGMVDIVYKKSN